MNALLISQQKQSSQSLRNNESKIEFVRRAHNTLTVIISHVAEFLWLSVLWLHPASHGGQIADTAEEAGTCALSIVKRGGWRCNTGKRWPANWAWWSDCVEADNW